MSETHSQAGGELVQPTNTNNPPSNMDKNTISLESFKTRQLADKGVDVEIRLPDNTPSGHTIKILGTDSDAYRKARFQRSRKSAEILGFKDEGLSDDEIAEARAEMNHQADLDLLASLVVGWSFDTPFSRDEARQLLADAPSIAEQIDRAAADRTRFFKKP